MKTVKRQICSFIDGHYSQSVSPTRIVILGKTGSGKSSLANTILGEKVFTISHAPNSETKICRAETKSVNGRSITLIDTPGFFDTERSEERLKPEIVRCITECAPGPHAFLIVLKVEKFTEQEQVVVTKICKYFSNEVFTYATIVFTRGDQLPEGMKIEEFASRDKNLSDLVMKCGGRCHVVDNKHWKNNMEQDEYRTNKFHVAELLKTIDEMIEANKGGYYTVEMKIQKRIKQSSAIMPQEEIREQTKRYWLPAMIAAGTGIVLMLLFGKK